MTGTDSTAQRSTAPLDRRDPAWARDFAAILQAYEEAGGDASFLRSPSVASLVVSANKVLGANEVPGVRIDSEPLEDGVKARIVVAPNAKLEQPIHLCFGMIPAEGVQHIIPDFEVGEGAQVQILAHCTFPNAIRLRHIMEARLHVGPNARFTYTEVHYHGPHGGIEVLPKLEAQVDEGGEFISTFSLVHGRVGRMKIDYVVDVGSYGITTLTTKAYGWADDDITVQEVVRLNGEGARGMTKSRVAVRDRARSHVFTATEGNAPLTRGHMDCTEIVRDEAIADNAPQVVVRNDRAQVTHEAAIGTVNHKELETLMARGLDEEKAVDVIIRGMLTG